MTDVNWISSKDEFITASLEPGLVTVLFTAPSWCGPCQRFEPHYARAASVEKDIKFYAVDIDKAPWAVIDYGIRGVPTCWLYEDGQFVRQVNVPQSAIAFIKDIKE